MVKLLRLTTENNLKFEANLDAGINVTENSQIALQNLTFESTDFSAISIDGANKFVSFSLDRSANEPAYSFLSEALTTTTYKKSNIDTFYRDLEASLNSCLEVSATTGDAFGSFKVLFPNDSEYEYGQVEKVTIIFKLSPVVLWFNYNDTGDRRSWSPILDPTGAIPLFTISSSTVGLPFDIDQDTTNNAINLGNVSLGAGVLATSEYVHYAYSDYPWCKGSACWMVRIGNLIDNGGAKNTNGFSIGLALTNEKNLDEIVDTAGDRIPDSLKSFEIRVSRPTDPYELTINGVTTVTGITPNSVIVANGNANDHILFEKNGTGFSISILQGTSGGGVSLPIHSHLFTREEMGKNMFPYFAIFGANADAMIGRPVLTVDAIINPFNLDPIQDTNDNMAITGLSQNILGGDNAFEAMSQLYSAVIPGLQNELFEDNETLTQYNPVIRMNGSVLRALGYDKSSYPNNINYNIQRPLTTMSIDDIEPEGGLVQFVLVSDGLSVLVNSDNYIVVLDSNPLYSYDASKFDYSNNITIPNSSKAKRGRRYNILATIPVNDNNGFIEFNANELVYIDLDNKFPQVIKNIRLRVLNKNFDEIETNGESVMTLLIKDA